MAYNETLRKESHVQEPRCPGQARQHQERGIPATTVIETVDPEKIAQIATEFTIKTIGAVGAVIAANKVMSTICEIAVVAAKAKLK